LYSTVITSVAKNDLTNKIRLIEALINSNEDYSSLLTDLFDEGYLGSVLFGLNYKETTEFAKFIETCFNLSKKRLNIKEFDTEKQKYNLPILQSIQNFFRYISSKEGIFVFGKLNTSIAEKNNLTESLYMLNDNIPKYHELLKGTEKSLSNDVVSIADIQIKTIYEESNEYLSDSFKMISDNYNKIITNYKTDETDRIKTEINKTILLSQKFEKGIPELEKHESDLCTVIQKHFSEISYDKKKSLGFKKGLEELLRVSHSSFPKNEKEVSDAESIKDSLKSLDPLSEWECGKCKKSFFLDQEELEELKNESYIEVKCPNCNAICTCEIDKKVEEEDE
jgi:DNA-directed RNA polymerase subunit RPC12/RpoP